MTPTMTNVHQIWKRTKVHFAVVAVGMIFMLAILAQENRFQDMTRDLLRLERERRDLDESRDRLILEIEHERNPARIRTLATDRFGLSNPDPSNFHDVNAERPAEKPDMR